MNEVVATELDPNRLNGLCRIGVDEISWRKHHKYLALVVDHDRAYAVWGDPRALPPGTTQVTRRSRV